MRVPAHASSFATTPRLEGGVDEEGIPTDEFYDATKLKAIDPELGENEVLKMIGEIRSSTMEKQDEAGVELKNEASRVSNETKGLADEVQANLIAKVSRRGACACNHYVR